MTKWVNVYQRDGVYTVAPYWLDSEPVARKHANHGQVDIQGKPVGDYYGSYPIEIELPL